MEQSLLLALARGDPECLESDAWNRIDAAGFLDLAGRHQVDSLCHGQLRKLEDGRSPKPHSVPKEIRTGLKHAFAHHTLRNESLRDDLRHVAVCLQAANVESLVFKGPWLALEAYPDPGARPIDDIDLGIRELDYTQALEALRAAGYWPVSPPPVGADEALRQAHFRQQLRFVAPSRRSVELHFRLINLGPPSIDEDWVWIDRRRLDLDGVSVHVPGPVAMLLHLALHANQHGFSILRLFYDLRFALERIGAELNERQFLERASRLRCRASVFHALDLARQLTGAPVPAPLLRALRPRRLRRWIFSRLWNLDRVLRLETIQVSNQVEGPRFYLFEMGTPLDKLHYLRGLLQAAGGVRPFVAATLHALRER